jgi:predicted N-acetyltransferase YhbS
MTDRTDGVCLHRLLAPLWVLPEYQRRGVGTALLEEVIRIADATSPPTVMCLQASPSGQELYERLGFRALEGKPDKMVRRGPVGSA